MSEGVATAARLAPWAMPELDGAPRPLVSRPAGKPGPDPAAANGNDLDQDAAAAAATAIAAECEKGYSEGLVRGLAEGREKGFSEGFAAGSKAAAEPLDAQAQRLAAIATRLAAPIPALDRQVEEAIAALALEVARCVIGAEVARSRDYLVRLIREAVAKIPIELGTVQIVLNPADVDILRRVAPDLECGGAVLVADPALAEGDAFVVADGEGKTLRDRRWRPRSGEGIAQVDLSLAARWRSVMLELFDGEED